MDNKKFWFSFFRGVISPVFMLKASPYRVRNNGIYRYFEEMAKYVDKGYKRTSEKQRNERS